MKNKIYTNITTFTIKKTIYDFGLGKVQIINGRYIVPTDDYIPLGVTLHLYIPAKSRCTSNGKTILNGRVYDKNYTGVITRAYYSILDNFIKLEIADNYKERTTSAKRTLKKHFQHRLNDPLPKENYSSKSLPVSYLNKSYLGSIRGDYERVDKYKITGKKISKLQKEHFKKQIRARNKKVKEILASS